MPWVWPCIGESAIKIRAQSDESIEAKSAGKEWTPLIWERTDCRFWICTVGRCRSIELGAQKEIPSHREGLSRRRY